VNTAVVDRRPGETRSFNRAVRVYGGCASTALALQPVNLQIVDPVFQVNDLPVIQLLLDLNIFLQLLFHLLHLDLERQIFVLRGQQLAVDLILTFAALLLQFLIIFGDLLNLLPFHDVFLLQVGNLAPQLPLLNVLLLLILNQSFLRLLNFSRQIFLDLADLL
jgi:hypothetical protein